MIVKLVYLGLFSVILACGGSSSKNTVSEGEVRSFSGQGNNTKNTTWGSAGSQLQRYAPAVYKDSISAPVEGNRPHPRTVSNGMMSKSESILNAKGLSSFVWQWGQFLDHDLSLTGSHNPPEPLMINVPIGDPMFDPFSTGAVQMPFMRSIYDVRTGTNPNNPRQQINEISSFIDGSNVYGSDDERASWLRTHQDGKLKTSEGNLLPFNDGTQGNLSDHGREFFVAGDIRSNEQAGLTAMHTLFVREHNRLAESYKEQNPDADDEEIYQSVRRHVGALLQKITYSEFLPAMLGDDFIQDYQGYDHNVNPSIANEFSTVFYRLGHSMIPKELLRLGADGQPIAQGNLSLADAFFKASLIVQEGGIDPLLRGLAHQQMEELDPILNENLRNFLFGKPGSGGLDLACLNLQRGRDHGLPDYNLLRYFMGLKTKSSFEEISSDPHVVQALKEVYGDINEIDPWVGALAEDHVKGANVGELVAVGLIRQFAALRDGDRFWYQNDTNLTSEQLSEIEATTLKQIIERNTEIVGLQDNVFYFQ